MNWKWPNRRKYTLILGVLCFVMLAVITTLANPLESDNSYLPLVILQRPSPTPSTTGLLLITEVLYNPSNDLAPEPAGEWIEIYNPGMGQVILSAYKLGDEPSLGGREGMLQFPAGSIMDPGEVIVVANKGATFRATYGFPPDFEMNPTDPTIPDMLHYPDWSTGKVELVNTGDEILILDGNDDQIDFVTWGDSTWKEAFDPLPPAADNGQSLERSPAYNDSNTAADWVIASTPGPYQLNLSPPTPVIPTGPTILLISEVFFNPSGENPGGEWVEIYNTGPNNALLSDFRIGDAAIQGAYEGMYYFPKGAVLLSGEGVVIANQSIVFEASYGFKPDFEINDSDDEISNMVKDSDWGKLSMNFNVNEDEVILLDSSDLIVDGVSWGKSTVILDPSVPKIDPDHSIERYPASTDTDSAADWRDQSNPDPGQFDLSLPTITPSPTATNPPDPLPALIINEIHADPDPVLGDANGDGNPDTSEDEFLEIVNTTDEAIDIGSWEIHDLIGLRHTFTDTLIIPAGCAVVVFSGGTPTGDFGNAVVQTSSSKLLLNNDEETISLLDDTATLIDSYTYGTEGSDNQSITRDPDITGLDPMVKHSQATNANGVLFSPGTKVDGSSFDGCSSSLLLKHTTRSWGP